MKPESPKIFYIWGHSYEMDMEALKSDPELRVYCDDYEKIIIYNDKDGVIHAKYINETTHTCKIVKAQTYGEDRYNFFTGAKVALQKLGKKCNSESKVIMTKQQLEALLSNIEVI